MMTNYNNTLNFNARVNMDLRCKKYYNQCPQFRDTVDIIKNDVEADEVSLSADRNRHWSGTRGIYALSEHSDGELKDYRIGTIDEGTYDHSGKISFYDRYQKEGSKSVFENAGEYYNIHLYYSK